MEKTFLGLPLALWAIGCLELTLVWVYVWPQGRAAGQQGLRYVALRWFHALTWLLLGIAAFVASDRALGGVSLAKPIALAALAVYSLFIGALARRTPRAF